MKKNIICIATIVIAMGLLLVAQAGTKQATICTTYGDDIYDYELDQMIDSVIPPSAKRLIVLTQCYGGNCLPSFAGGTNTAVVSATSTGQKAVYGGYDDDAANACKPGAGKTGQSVHDAGTAGKHSQETPSTGGGLAPGAVSLEPVTADGAVRSRHVIVYAGMPDKKGRDNAQRDKIKANFAGQTNTTVTTVGGEGPKDGWDKHGWARGLKDAINEAAAAIEAAPDPSKEQFLLFVTDHGDLHTVEYVTTPMPPSNSVVAANVAAFVAADFEELQFERPGFSITINLAPFTHEVGDNPDDYVSYFPTNAWRLLLTPPPPAEPLLLTAFDERFIEWEDGIVGNVPNEGLRLFFPVEPTLFIDSFFDVMYDVEIFNDTATNYQVMAFSQDTGPVAKGESEPDFFLIVEDTLIGENDMTYDGQEIVVNGCVATIDGVHVFDRLTLTNDAIVTHTSGSMGLALTVLEDLTLQTGSQIDASGRGSGPKPETTGRSGGSYGGLGEGALGDSCPTYGDSWRPVDSGSGGIGPDAITYGGGCVRLVANYLTLDGTICVDGQDGPLYTGGGSGGAIWIDVNGLSGSGLLQANGGTAGADGGAGGGGRIAVYAQNTEGFVPTAVEAKANSGAGWGSVFLGMPLSVACAVSGLGTCDPAEPVVIPYQGTNLFTFSSMPLSLATNGVSLSPSAMFEWVNAGLSRGTLDDAAWSALLTESSLLEAGFAALELAGVTPSFGSGVELPVNGLAGWSYTLQRRTSLTEGEWELVAGQTDILCSEDGVLVLSDTEMLPQAFYRVLATP